MDLTTKHSDYKLILDTKRSPHLHIYAYYYYDQKVSRIRPYLFDETCDLNETLVVGCYNLGQNSVTVAIFVKFSKKQKQSIFTLVFFALKTVLTS